MQEIFGLTGTPVPSAALSIPAADAEVQGFSLYINRSILLYLNVFVQNSSSGDHTHI